jgi:tRNA(Ile)-lysidine synthase
LIQVVSFRNPGKFGLKINVLETFEDFIQGEIIQQAITQIFKIHSMPMSMVDRIIDLSNSISGSKLDVNKKISVLKDREELIFFKKQIKKDIDMEIDKIGEYQVGNKTIILKKVTKRSVKKLADPNIEFLDFDLVPARLKIKSWQQGDTFQPLGMEGTMKVSDFLTNNKVSMLDKDDVLILSSQSDILWVCGMRISHKFRVTESSKRFLKIEIIENSEENDGRGD